MPHSGSVNLGQETVKINVCLSSTTAFYEGRPMQPKKSSLTTLSNAALCKLRDEIAALLNSRAKDLRRELDQLTGGAVANGGEGIGGESVSAKRKKIAPKYRGPDGDTWTGRGMKPRWLTSAMKEGKKPEDFLIVAPNVH
jgi:DNA-binding protein H-NS